MDYTLVEFPQLDTDGINRLAALHHSVMQTLLSNLGLPVVLRYYQVAREERSVVGICAVSPSGEMLGWALGSPHPNLINSRVRTPLTWFLLQIKEARDWEENCWMRLLKRAAWQVIILWF